MNDEGKLLYIVVCIYSVSLGEILKVIEKNIHGFNIRCIVVNNSTNVERLECNNLDLTKWHYLVGSNLESEFSAYVEGLNFIHNFYSREQAPILIFNDTAITKHNFTFYVNAALSHYSIIHRAQIPAIAGRVDKYNSICFSNPWSGINGYVSSFIMLINHNAAPIFIKSLVDINEYIISDDDILSVNTWSNSMPMALREFIISHLIDLDSPIAWYQAKNKNISKKRINQKARCVFHEHYISGSLAKNGIMISLFPTWKLMVKNVIFEQLAKIKRLWIRFSSGK
ncbi:hypothetical protein [Aeromonas rivipollensis]